MIAPTSASGGGLLIRLISEFEVLRAGRPVPMDGSRKARTLLKLLSVERSRWVRVGEIVEALWDGPLPRRPRQNVATIVSRLRSTLGEGVVEGGGERYRLGRPPVVEVDLDLAEWHIAEATARQGAGEAALASVAASAALALLSDGGALVVDADAAWAEPARMEARSLLRAARSTAAEAALALGDAAQARELAAAAAASDGYDEHAYRQLMRAEAELGEPARALAAYERLRRALADELGVDPSAQSRSLHLAILRGDTPRAPGSSRPDIREARATRTVRAAAMGPSAGRTIATGGLVGRTAVLDLLTRRWSAAEGGTPAMILITGEAGIGKTRLAAELADVVERAGGNVLRARCYEAERSLFLQPLVEAIGEHAATASPHTIRAVTGDWAGPLISLVPQVAAIVEPLPVQRDGGEVARRRAYDAFTRYVCGLADRPVLLLLDDLHQAGLSTVELLHYLIRRAGCARLLVVGTVRSGEGMNVLSALADVGERIEIGPLSPDSVAAMAEAAGHADRAASIIASTGGHTLFVVETLRALGGGELGIPESLQAAVLARAHRTGEQTEGLLRGAAVLGSAIEPEALARLLDISPVAATATCERALAAGLLVVADRAYEFANDLIREVLYRSMPAPTRVAYHRRAADLQGDRPESVGTHASAAGDWNRAARAWLVAGEQAFGRAAHADADALLSHAIDAASRGDNHEVAGRAHLARGIAREALARYAEALTDLETSVVLARGSDDRRLEMRALRALGNDVSVALGRPITDCIPLLHSGRAIAEALGDKASEADLLGRLAVIFCNRLQFNEALGYGERAVRVARAGGDAQALAGALDGLKTAYAYLGEIEPLISVLAELEPLLRRHGDLWRLAWAVQESAFPAIAGGRWDEALHRLNDAYDINRRSGHIAYEGWFVGQIGWVHRLRGDLTQALSYGERAVELTSDSVHAWWRSAACTQLAGTLLATGESAGAVDLLRTGHDYALQEGAEAYLLNCLGPLAEITGDPAVINEAGSVLAGIDVPDGSAWLLGAEACLALARAWLAHGEPGRALSIVDQIAKAAERIGWTWVAAAAHDVRTAAGLGSAYNSSARNAAARAAPSDSTGR